MNVVLNSGHLQNGDPKCEVRSNLEVSCIIFCMMFACTRIACDVFFS